MLRALVMEVPEPTGLVVYTLEEWKRKPDALLRPDKSSLEQLVPTGLEAYPPAWDTPAKQGEAPTIRRKSFFEWQRENPGFSRLGLNSLQISEA